MTDKLRDAAKDAVWHFNRMTCSVSYGFLKRMENLQAALAATADAPPTEPTEEMVELAGKAVLKIRGHLKQRHGSCNCGVCLAIGVLYGYHCAALTARKEE